MRVANCANSVEPPLLARPLTPLATLTWQDPNRKTAAKGKLEHGLLLELAYHPRRCATRQRNSAGDGVEACWQALLGNLRERVSASATNSCARLFTAASSSPCFLSTGNLTSSVPGQYLQPTQCPSAPNQQCQTPAELARGHVVARRV